MIIIGDVHGKIGHYLDILKKFYGYVTIQVGDFGFKKEHDWFIENISQNFNTIIFGNHEYYPYLDKEYSAKDYSFFDIVKPDYTTYTIMTIRGAKSIDMEYRREGIDWFANEEIPYTKWFEILDMIEKRKPNVIISHDCPQIVREIVFQIYDKSLTSQGLNSCFESHKPDLWIFGHHHISKDIMMDGTRFICLAELEYLNLYDYLK